MNMQKLLQEAKKMQVKLQKDQQELANLTFEGNSSLVSVKLNGNYDVLEVLLNLDEDIKVEDKDMLEDMILLAISDAIKKIKKKQEETMGKYGSSMFGMM